MLEQVVATLAVLVLMALTLYALRAKGLVRVTSHRAAARSGMRVEILERVALTPQHSLHVVRFADKVFLVAASPAACTPVCQAEWNEGAISRESGAGGPSERTLR